MKTESNFIDYGIYIDRKYAYVISLDHTIHETLIVEDTQHPKTPLPDSTHVRHQVDVQNYKNEQLKKICKSNIDKLVNARQVLIFGPSISNFILQKEIYPVKLLKHVPLVLITTDVLGKQEALHFVKDHYSPVVAGNEIFTLPKKE